MIVARFACCIMMLRALALAAVRARSTVWHLPLEELRRLIAAYADSQFIESDVISAQMDTFLGSIS